MTIANTVRDEESRLAELNSLGILDTPPEERFDRFTRLAKRAFNVPFGTLSLVDENREWFKSNQGMETDQIPRAGSFSTEAIKCNDIMVVNDAGRDPRFAQYARDTGIKFYAGCPIKTHRGYTIGTLCIADTTPRNFYPKNHACLLDLASLIEEEVTVQTIANIDDLTSLFNRRGFLGIASTQSLSASVCDVPQR